MHPLLSLSLLKLFSNGNTYFLILGFQGPFHYILSLCDCVIFTKKNVIWSRLNVLSNL